jgi:hypothetical protein
VVSAAVAAVIVSIPAIDPASAFERLGLRPGAMGLGTPQTLQPKGRVGIAVGTGKIATHVDTVTPGRQQIVIPGRGGRGDPGKGTGITYNNGDHPGGDGPRPPRPPKPPVWHPPHLPPVPIVPINPVVVTRAPPPIVSNPNPIIGNPPSSFIRPPIAPRTVRRSGGAPPANEQRYVPDEVVIEVATTMTTQQINVLAQRHRLAILQSISFQLGGTTLLRGRITDHRAVPVHVQELEGDVRVLSAQPNYLYALIAEGAPVAPAEGDPSQYMLDKMHLPQAHALSTGDKVLVAVIDSGVDINHPDLAGDIAGTFDAIGKGLKVHSHGTAIAGAIAAHGKLMGAAPAARILAIRAFSGTDNADGTTVAIAAGLDWAVSHGARVINMSFAGPRDPDITNAVSVARARGVVLVAATGNQGAKSPPLFPAADPDVIAVTAIDENDQMPPFANRGNYVAVAAPGVDLMLLGPNGTYQMSSGTSFSSAYVSGTVALMLERRPSLTPDAVRQGLTLSAHHLGTWAPSEFGAGLVDAYQAVLSVAPPVAADAAPESSTPVASRP